MRSSPLTSPAPLSDPTNAPSVRAPRSLWVIAGALGMVMATSSCVFLDDRTPCAVDDECGFVEKCGADGFCQTNVFDDAGGFFEPDPEPTAEPEPTPFPNDGGNLRPDAGALDAGEPDGGTDAGPQDAGLDGGGPRDAGPRDAGPRDAGPQDAGVDGGGLQDAGPQDAGVDGGGLQDAGFVKPDGGAPDAGACELGGIANDPNHCGACGTSCESGVCNFDVCAPRTVANFNGLASTFVVDEAEGHFYLGESTSDRLYRVDFDSVPTLLETNINVANVAIDDNRLIVTGEGSLAAQLLNGPLPVSSLNSMSRADATLSSLRDSGGRAFGLGVSAELAVFGHGDGIAIYRPVGGSITNTPQLGRYQPTLVDADLILAIDAAGQLRLTSLTGSGTPIDGGRFTCPDGQPPTIADRVFTGDAQVYLAGCVDNGVGLFVFESTNAYSDVISFTPLGTAPTARTVNMALTSNALYVSHFIGDAFSIVRVLEDGSQKVVVDQAAGRLGGIAASDNFIYFAVLNASDSTTRFFRFETVSVP